MTAQDAIHALWTASIATPIDLKTNGARDIAVVLNLSLAGILGLYRVISGICRQRTSGISHFPWSHRRGGQFAAWEQPELFRAGIRAAFRSRRQSR